MNYNPENVAGYISPLTDEEHATLGRIAVLWGQIESAIDNILPTFCGLSSDEIDALQIFDKPIAAKAALLKRVSKRRSRADVHGKVEEFLQIIDDTKVRRNQAFHSMWGWRLDARKRTVEPCARYLKSPGQGIKASALSQLERELNRCARLGKDLLHLAWGEGPDYNPSRFFHGADDPQEWFEQWLERNPVYLHNLDCGPKTDQLPRLREPHQLK